MQKVRVIRKGEKQSFEALLVEDLEKKFVVKLSANVEMHFPKSTHEFKTQDKK